MTMVKDGKDNGIDDLIAAPMLLISTSLAANNSRTSELSTDSARVKKLTK